MRKHAHTPGPWTVADTVKSEKRTVYIRVAMGPKTICATGVYGRKIDGTPAGQTYRDRFGIDREKPVISEPEAEANAQLIAAAPDLLAACQLVVTIDGYLSGKLPDDTMRAVFAAIAKAEGN